MVAVPQTATTDNLSIQNMVAVSQTVTADDISIQNLNQSARVER